MYKIRAYLSTFFKVKHVIGSWDPDLHQSGKLDPDPHQFADDKQNVWNKSLFSIKNFFKVEPLFGS
jgi:hypothetical protein